MRRLPAAAALALFALMPAAAPAGGPAQSTATASTPVPPSVVVLDVAQVYKGHTRFKQRMEELKRERDAFEKQFIQDKQAVLARGEKLSQYKSGSAEYKEIDARMSRELAELRIKAVSKNGDLLEREGRIYYETYQEIVAAVTLLAERYNLSMVVRYDSESTDPQDRGSILKAISRDVVYQRNLDLTKLVIEQVNGPKATATPPQDKVSASERH
jgi:Skp family chaperone for outer membrane proteins